MTTAFSRYLNIRQAYAPSFSPDGKKVSFITNITGVPQAWVVNVEGGWPNQLTFDTERVSEAKFSPTRDQVVFSRDVGGNENAQIFLVNSDGSGERKLTHADDAVHIFGAWSKDGKYIAFTANRRDKSKFDVYVQNIDDEEARLVWENNLPGFLVITAFSPDTSRLLVYFSHNNMNQNIFELEIESGEIRQLTEHEGNIRYQFPVYASDGRSIFSACDRDRDLTTLIHITLDDLQHQFLEETKHEIEDIVASTDGQWLLWTTNVDGANQIKLMDLGTRQVSQPADLPIGVLSGFSFPVFSPDNQQVAFSFTTPTQTSDIWVWDIKKDRLHTATQSSYAGIATSSFKEPALVHYPTFDGLSIPAWFYRPDINESDIYPIVVIVHGGPEGQSQPILDIVAQYFISRGYGVFVPNVRGSSGYGKRYLALDNVEKRMDFVADLSYAVKWLETQPNVDTHRIAVYGGSYGGFMVLSALTTYPDLWAAGIDIVGISNFVTFLENTGAYRRSHREGEYGSLEHDREFLTSISPIHQVDKISAPLMVVHGANDPRVPLNEAEQIVTALKARNIPVEFLVYHDEGHGLVKLKNRLDAYPKMADFLDKYIGDKT